MPIEVKKREGESMNSLLFRFNKKLKHSGIMKEMRKRRFTKRAPNKRKKRLAAIYRTEKQGEFSLQKKYGLLPQRKNK